MFQQRATEGKSGDKTSPCAFNSVPAEPATEQDDLALGFHAICVDHRTPVRHEERVATGLLT